MVRTVRPFLREASEPTGLPAYTSISALVASAAHTHTRREREDKTYHDAGEVRGHDGVNDHENVLVTQVVEEEEETCGEEVDEAVKIKEVRGPGRWLVLGH